MLTVVGSNGQLGAEEDAPRLRRHVADLAQRDLLDEVVEVEEEEPLCGHGEDSRLPALVGAGDERELLARLEEVREGVELAARPPVALQLALAGRPRHGLEPRLPFGLHQDPSVGWDVRVDRPHDLTAAPPEIGVDVDVEAVRAPERASSVRPAKRDLALVEAGRGAKAFGDEGNPIGACDEEWLVAAMEPTLEVAAAAKRRRRLQRIRRETRGVGVDVRDDQQ